MVQHTSRLDLFLVCTVVVVVVALHHATAVHGLTRAELVLAPAPAMAPAPAPPANNVVGVDAAKERDKTFVSRDDEKKKKKLMRILDKINRLCAPPV
uniref:Uncharacterized protein n=2 Tax=Oryza sativa subsp. japonica TaxID=39947 RepID=A0A5S6R6P8_ORYSJ|nr:hypothetical protein [Oryza sativa Japonica Group]ABF96245.1 hypothetical protein LOC_Os03g26180 [Oryza sativa Japonica Group]